tara:strand:- start:2455 stop:3177 length:723 start_codon:yes stop_codon:yes gene_type:complete
MSIDIESAFDISIIITGHREGLLSAMSIKSALRCAELAAAKNLSCEFIVVLDNVDLCTDETVSNAFANIDHVHVIKTEYGDPGLARNRGLSVATGTCSTLLDADDLWSENWLVDAFPFIQHRPDAIAHSACNVAFGGWSNVWWHMDSELDSFDRHYLDWGNYWDALIFARTDLLRKYPYRANDMILGFGHEDWDWNRITIDAGVPHKPVPDTIHFKRKRFDSQSMKVYAVEGSPWPRDVR